MKKLLSTALALIIATMFTACAPADPVPQTANKAITEYTTEGKVTKLVPDETATGELTVNLMGGFLGFSVYIKKMYNELYPNVTLNLTVWDEHVGDRAFDWRDEMTKFQTSVMARSGPDVFLTVGEVGDLDKMMQSGICADLAPYYENDKNFNINDFNKSVFYSGQRDGNQYITPIEYELPLFITTQSIVDKIGFNIAKCKDYFSTGEELGRVLKENKFNLTSNESVKWFAFPYHFLTFGNFAWLDYKSNTANLNTPDVENGYRMLKEVFFAYLQSSKGGMGMTSSFLEAGALINEKAMFSELSTCNRDRIIMNSKVFTGMGEEPIIFPWRNINGGITSPACSGLAVSSESENKQNAYNFIKMMISEELYKSMYEADESGIGKNLGSWPSVNNNVVRYLFEQDKGEKGTKTPYFDGQENYQLEYVPDEIIEQYMGFINEVDSVSFDPKVAYDVCAIMQPYLEDKATYEECIEKAQGMLEIYMTE